uniref:Retrotrans_gag domain-containing protein n=1 Tax=Globodera pallida TaxID=36090 RepID=A0A183BSK1_GLOPA
MEKNLASMADVLQQLTNIVKQQQSTSQVQNNITLPDVQPYSHEDESTEFEEWIERFQFSVECAATNLQDGAKVKLLMTKLSPSAFGEYKRSCLPDEITQFDFGETKKRLTKLFAHPPSLAIDRYECLKASREEGEEFGVFINRLKALFRKFRYSELTEDQFKSLILITSLKSPSEAKLRQHILTRLTAEETKTTKTPNLFDAITEELRSSLKTEAEQKAIRKQKGKFKQASQIQRG